MLSRLRKRPLIGRRIVLPSITRTNQVAKNVIKRRRIMDEAPSTNWFDLPLEMREMVIDKMNPKTRCKFAQCSKLCEYEVKKSKNYLYKIELFQNLETNENPQLRLNLTKTAPSEFWFEFIDAGSNQTSVQYICDTLLGEVVKWSKIESGKPKEVRWKYFNEYLEKYKHCIRNLNWIENELSMTDFNVRSIKHLEELVILSYSLINDLNISECRFIEWKQLMWLEKVWLPFLKLTFKQLIELKGEDICVASDEFDEENINKYLKMIKKGEIHNNAKRIRVRYGYRNMDIQSVMNGLDAFDYFNNEENVERGEWLVELINTLKYFIYSIVHTFNFLSDEKKNGIFRVELGRFVKIEWKQKAEHA